MEAHYPFLGLPSLVSDFDDELSGSEGSIPADSPTFYKRGESSRLAEMSSVFHPPTSAPYKTWRANSLYGGENSFPSYQHHPYPLQSWDDVADIDIDSMEYPATYDQSALQDAEAQWPGWDNSAPCSIPISTARNSFRDTPPRQGASEAFWRGSPLEDDLGPTSPLSSATSFDSGVYRQDSGHPAPEQPHNNHYDYTQSQSLYSYRSLASSSSSSAPTVSASAFSVSPASPTLSSASTASSPGLPSTPPIPITLPELRQPRPRRPIPIIPLSKLASACEKIYIPPSASSTLLRPKHFSQPDSKKSSTSSYSKRDTLFTSFSSPNETLPFYYGSNFDENLITGNGYTYFNDGLGHRQ